MAKVQIQVQVSGGEILKKKASTVGELREELGEDVENYTVTVNGEPVEDDHEFSSYEFVSFTPAVKGGM